MDRDLWRRVEELFHTALEQPPEARRTFLEEACGKETELLRQVEVLLSNDERGSNVLEKPVLADFKDSSATGSSLVGRSFGPYRVLSLLGAGGMGAVYRAHDTQLSRDVAIKTLPAEFARDPQRLGRFWLEARTLASLNHPNIAAIYGRDKCDGMDCLVLELVEGETLRGPLPLAAALDRACQVAEALVAAHKHGIIHRDLKPANVKVTPQGRVKVLDFSLAKSMWEIGADFDRPTPPVLPGIHTLSGHVLGTPGYMSPEQAAGRPVDQRTDIWAFGCLLYELLTGKKACPSGDSDPDWSALPAATPANIRELLRHCLQKDPEQRLMHMAEARRTIEQAQSLRDTASLRVRLLTGRHLWGAVALIALAAVFLAATNAGGWWNRVLGRPVLKPIQSLAVLPLENLSRDPDQEYFADGMTDELITALAKIGALRVVSRTSVMRYRGTKKPLPEIARELGVDAVIEGTVLRAQNQVRITAQLIRASPEEHLWADQYVGNLKEILSLQDTVAQDVARSIKIRLTPRERGLLATARPVVPAAYEAYLKGRYLWGRPTEENLARSREYFEQAIQKDPEYALAWAGLAEVYDYLASWGILPSRDARPRARSAAEKALQLDSSLAEALIALAEVKLEYEWDWAATERLCRQAIQISPNYGQAHHVYATYLDEVGRTREAVAEARRAREVEPTSPEYIANVVWKLYLDRRYQEAVLENQKVSELYPGYTAQYALASVYLQMGRSKEALAELRKDVAASSSGIIELAYFGHALGVTGARAEGKQVLDRMLSLAQRRYVPPDYIAMVYEGLGERQRALDWYEKAAAEHSINGWILPDPQLDSIRAEPRFRRILQRMGLPN